MNIDALKEMLSKYDSSMTYFGVQLDQLDKENLLKLLHKTYLEKQELAKKCAKLEHDLIQIRG